MTSLRISDNKAKLAIPTETCSCGRNFIRLNSMQKICVKCAIAAPKLKRKAEAKAEKENFKRRKEAVKPRAKWVAEAQAAVNRYARLRDIRAGYGCITCGAQFGSKYGGAFDAGHMHSRGSNPHLRFHLHNIALQCVKDNRYLGGLALEFRNQMVARLGIERIEAMEATHGPAKKHSVEYLKRLKQVFTKKANRMEKRHEK